MTKANEREPRHNIPCSILIARKSMPNQKRIELRHVVKIFDIDLNLLERLHFRLDRPQIALSFPFLANLFNLRTIKNFAIFYYIGILFFRPGICRFYSSSNLFGQEGYHLYLPHKNFRVIIC